MKDTDAAMSTPFVPTQPRGREGYDEAYGRDYSPPFHPAWWLPGPHLQSIWPNLLRPTAQLQLVSETLDTEDGDFVVVDWYGPPHGPVALLLHGLCGSSRSRYLRSLQMRLARQGWRTAALNLRGAGPRPNRRARFYHAGDTADLHTVYCILKQRAPHTPIAVAGFSLGGNILLKWLGERGASLDLLCAAAVSVPFDLNRCADYVDRGLGRYYRDYLLLQLRRAIQNKFSYFMCVGLNAETAALQRVLPLHGADTFRTFDERVTAPLNGFNNAAHYYAQASSQGYLCQIHTPTLIIHAKDDPMIPADAIPSVGALSPYITMEVSAHGGHVGFVAGSVPWRSYCFHDWRIAKYFGQALADRSNISATALTR